MRTENQIIQLEWNMFTSTQSAGGRAVCQDDRSTFEIMRKAQMSVWGEIHQALWLQDLEMALAQQRNLMAEKYAWMMADTHPEEFAKIKEGLPYVGEDAHRLINAIVDISLRWEEEVAEKYPIYMSRGRRIRKDLAHQGMDASVQTYLTGELLTNSLNTLLAYYDEVVNSNENLLFTVHENTVRSYRYHSLAEYENDLSAQ